MYKIPYLVIVSLLSLTINTYARSFPDNIQPDGISDQTWSNLTDALDAYKLMADDGLTGDSFGWSVSVSADRALIGAMGADGSAMNAGAAYIFDYDGNNWIQSAKLTADDGEMYDNFGWSVSLFGDRALIGANRDDNIGSAYVFDFDGSHWVQSAKLTSEDANRFDEFGGSVSLFGNLAMVGAEGHDESASDGGAVYVFELNDSTWIQVDKLVADEPTENDRFGGSVSLQDGRVLIGAYRGDTGSAFVFDFDGTHWVQSAKLTADDGATNDSFGRSVSLFGDRALIGAYQDDNLGSAYIFDFNGTHWVQTTKLTADDGKPFDGFGQSVSLFGDRALIGAYYASALLSSSGSAYVYELNGTHWIQTTALTDSAAEEGGVFGYSVSLSDNKGLIGAPGKSDTKGEAQVFEIQNNLYDFIFKHGFEE